ncbi:MAG: pyrimidine-nucleoside phosphorylase [Lachnospiraceae bacterium]|nr:pyrimidine-nucleoside phosphorylase [Lachnospiraceae bacterium]
MLMVDIIRKKRDGGKLSKEEIDFFINGYVAGEIPDYQVSALMMAIFFKGMDDEETHLLTSAMLHSGEVLDLSGIKGFKVDKHSTGGVGDKTSLVLTPMVASCGVRVAKMSGRGLGHTGGTIDKLESFKGFSTAITNEQFIENVNNIGISIMGQTKNLAPADKLLYALRDVTATVDNMSLIASSIMSKKLAAGANGIVLDVKSGSGAFMKTDEDARLLAEKMVSIGKSAGVKVMAVISDMDQPLGRAVGNAIEVKEAIDTLKGNGPEDLHELCLTLGSYMVYFAGKASDRESARAMLEESISSGRALDKLADFIEAQGGSRDDVYNTDNLPKASKSVDFTAPYDCYVSSIMSEDIGVACLLLGGGRRSKEDVIDLSVGIYLHKKVGEKCAAGEKVASLYGNDDKKLAEALERLKGAYSFSDTPVQKNSLIKGIVE